MTTEAAQTLACPDLRFESDGNVTLGAGEIRLQANGRVLVEFIPATPLPPFAEIPSMVTLSGTSETGHTLEPTRAWFTTVTRSPGGILRSIEFTVTSVSLVRSTADIVYARAFLQNCRVLGRHRLTIDGFDVSIRDIYPSTADKPEHYGALLEISRAAPFPYNDGLKLISIVGRLLSVAQRTLIVAPAVYGFLDADRQDVPERIDAFDSDRAHMARHTLIRNWAAPTLAFVASTYPQYVAREAAWDLPGLIEWFWRIGAETTLEIKFVYASVFVESAKFGFAKNVAGHTQDINAVAGLIRGFRKMMPSGKLGSVSFEDLVKEMGAHLGIATVDTSFIDNRNALFHSGRSAAAQLAPGTPSHPYLKPEFLKLATLVDDIMLQVLGFTGPIFRTWSLDEVPYP